MKRIDWKTMGDYLAGLMLVGSATAFVMLFSMGIDAMAAASLPSDSELVSMMCQGLTGL